MSIGIADFSTNNLRFQRLKQLGQRRLVQKWNQVLRTNIIAQLHIFKRLMWARFGCVVCPLNQKIN
jgi:hypothetical protein